MKEEKERISIIVRKDDHERWKEYAERTDQSVSELVRRSVNRSVGDRGLKSRVSRVESKLDLLLDHLGVQVKEVSR